MVDRTPVAPRWQGPEPWYDRIALVVRAAVWLVADVQVLHADRVPRRGSVLFAPNHVSRLDPPVIGAVLHRLGRRVRFLAVEGLFSVRVVGWALRTTGMIPVRRGAGPEPMVANACAALAAGQAVVVYPEGTIPRPGETLPGRPGAGLLALQASAQGVPVVPVASWGLDHRGRGLLPRLLRRRATVAFGPPVDLSPWVGRQDREAQIAASDAVLTAVRGLLPEAERASRRAA